MGYDIFSMRENAAAAQEYARKHTPWVFTESGEYRGTDTVYYRMNIWGMSVLHRINDELGIGYLNEYLYDNSGHVIRSWECREASQTIADTSDDDIRAAVERVVKGDETLDNPEEIAGWVKEVRAWGEYLGICSDLKGCEVL